MKTLLTILLLIATLATNAQKWEGLIDKAENYRKKGNPSSSVECANNARTMMLEQNEVQNPLYLKSIIILAQSYSDMGDHQKSLANYKQALNRLSANSGKGPEYAKLQIMAAMEQAHNGNYPKAIQMLKNSEEILVQTNGKQCEDLVLYYSALASVYAMQNDVDSELDAVAQLCTISEQHYDELNVGRLAGYEHLAILCHNIGRYPEAIENYKKALSIIEKNFGKKSAQYGKCLHYLGNSYCRNHQFDESIECLSQACKILVNILGDNNIDVADAIHALSEPYYQKRDYKNAYANLKKALEIYNERLRIDFQYLTTLERENYWKHTNSIHENLLQILTKIPENENIAGDAYNSLLITKTLLLQSEIKLGDMVLSSKDTTLINLYQSITNKRHELTNITQDSRYQNTYDSLYKQIENREQELMKRVSTLGELAEYTRVNWKDVQAQLSDNDLAVEFFYLGEIFGALIVKKSFSSPKTILLANREYSNPYSNSEMYDDIWLPILPYTEPGARIYFSPAGKLHTLAIEYAPAADTILVSDLYEIHRLSSTKNITTKTSTSREKKATVYGGIIYDTDVETMKNESSKFNIPHNDGGNRKLDTRLSNLYATYLKGSLKESQQVTNYLDSMNYSVQYYTDQQANEESFKNLSGQGLQIIHIATHGFYLSNENNNPNEALNNSGLLFSGCNNSAKVPQNIDNGILTASEISNLDLRNTSLVVLSACETGLGEITSDGVFGLQRGFKKAGVQSIIMSLWPVNDYATQLLMTNFYKNMNLGMDQRTAFVKSQQSLRKKKGVRPEHWAAFIILD